MQITRVFMAIAAFIGTLLALVLSIPFFLKEINSNHSSSFQYDLVSARIFNAKGEYIDVDFGPDASNSFSEQLNKELQHLAQNQKIMDDASMDLNQNRVHSGKFLISLEFKNKKTELFVRSLFSLDDRLNLLQSDAIQNASDDFSKFLKDLVMTNKHRLP